MEVLKNNNEATMGISVLSIFVFSIIAIIILKVKTDNIISNMISINTFVSLMSAIYFFSFINGSYNNVRYQIYSSTIAVFLILYSLFSIIEGTYLSYFGNNYLNNTDESGLEEFKRNYNGVLISKLITMIFILFISVYGFVLKDTHVMKRGDYALIIFTLISLITTGTLEYFFYQSFNRVSHG